MTFPQQAPPARTTDNWYTPPEILEQLGAFDLDPASSRDRPRNTARVHLTPELNGLEAPWVGRVWLNPPYSEVGPWIKRLADHGDGVALVFARTETRWAQDFVFPRASGVLFLRGRLRFWCETAGVWGPGPNVAGAPSMLVSYDPEGLATNLWSLMHCGLKGALWRLR